MRGITSRAEHVISTSPTFRSSLNMFKKFGESARFSPAVPYFQIIHNHVGLYLSGSNHTACAYTVSLPLSHSHTHTHTHTRTHTHTHTSLNSILFNSIKLYWHDKNTIVLPKHQHSIENYFEHCTTEHNNNNIK